MVQTRSQARLARGSHLLRLPNELLAKISEHLNVPSLARLTRTNRELHTALDETLYRKRGHRYVIKKKVAIKRGSYGYRRDLADAVDTSTPHSHHSNGRQSKNESARSRNWSGIAPSRARCFGSCTRATPSKWRSWQAMPTPARRY